MIFVGDILISSEVLETYFCCDLEKCHGACCIEGESGAPIKADEIESICDSFQDIVPILPQSNIEYIEQNGLMYEDADGDMVTQIVDGGRCVFTCFEPDQSARCAFEMSYNEGGGCSFYKPISCHLFPIRVAQLSNGRQALNYSRWFPICEPARDLGKKLGIRLYQFLKEPLIRAYGEEWYEQLLAEADQYFYVQKERYNEP